MSRCVLHCLYWVNQKEALSNMFLVVVFAGMEVKEHYLPSCAWSSNTILCVGVSTAECRLCILHTQEIQAQRCLQTACREKTVSPASGMFSWDLVLPIFWLVGCWRTSALTPWQMGAELVRAEELTDQSQRRGWWIQWGCKGDIRNTEGWLFCCCVFS